MPKVMTKQQMVNKSFKALWKQGELSQSTSSKTGTTICRYRRHCKASDKVRCGIGHLIPDLLYKTYFDKSAHGVAVEQLVQDEGNSSIQKLFGYLNDPLVVWFLEDLQNCHDTIGDEDNFRISLFINYRELCDSYELKMPKVSKTWRKKIADFKAMLDQ